MYVLINIYIYTTHTQKHAHTQTYSHVPGQGAVVRVQFAPWILSNFVA